MNLQEEQAAYKEHLVSNYAAMITKFRLLIYTEIIACLKTNITDKNAVNATIDEIVARPKDYPKFPAVLLDAAGKTAIAATVVKADFNQLAIDMKAEFARLLNVSVGYGLEAALEEIYVLAAPTTEVTALPYVNPDVAPVAPAPVPEAKLLVDTAVIPAPSNKRQEIAIEETPDWMLVILLNFYNTDRAWLMIDPKKIQKPSTITMKDMAEALSKVVKVPEFDINQQPVLLASGEQNEVDLHPIGGLKYKDAK